MHNKDSLNEYFYEPQTSLSQQLRSGLFKNVDDGDVVYLDLPIFLNANLIFSETGKKIVPFEKNSANNYPYYYTLKNKGKINGISVFDLEKVDLTK